MRVRDVEFAAIDFESAGVARGQTDVPIQIGIAILRGGGIDASESFRSYLHSDRPVAWGARKVHGIQDADLAGAPALLALWPQLRSRLAGRWIVSHGAGTEKRFLRAFPGHGFGPWVDTLSLFHAALPGVDSHSLSALASACGCEAECLSQQTGFRWHDALSDALASLVLLRWLIARCRLGDEPADILLNPDRARYYALRSSRPR
ncbi:MAG: 3'-5' exonuclease [Terrimicrobiaceae bacterium]|nr:3'-5' exonuclease [Terrimicrobiaceae bacterium]